MSTSRYIEIRPNNIPSDGVVSFKNGFPILAFTVSAQEGLLDPSTIRIVGKFNAYSDNDTPTPTPVQAGDNLAAYAGTAYKKLCCDLFRVSVPARALPPFVIVVTVAALIVLLF